MGINAMSDQFEQRLAFSPDLMRAQQEENSILRSRLRTIAEGYGEHLIRSAIEEASPYMTGAEIRNIFKEEMERRYGKEA